jgi:hypothetical protein
LPPAFKLLLPVLREGDHKPSAHEQAGAKKKRTREVRRAQQNSRRKPTVSKGHRVAQLGEPARRPHSNPGDGRRL